MSAPGCRVPGFLCQATKPINVRDGTTALTSSPTPHPIGAPPDGGTVTKKEETFDTAIELFRNSPQAATPIGKRILETLQNGRKNNLLSFAKMGPAGDSSRELGTIRITEMYERDPMKTSIWLVHEAYHVAVAKDGLLYVDEEIESRRIQAEYWALLEGSGIQLPDGHRYLLSPQDSLLLKAYRSNRTIDWVISMYKDEASFKITADWIVKHKAEWGGLCNRTLDTRKFYAKILVDSQPTFALDPRSIDSNVAETLLELLECNRFEADSIVTQAGKDDAVTVLKNAPESSKKRLDSLLGELKKSGRLE